MLGTAAETDARDVRAAAGYWRADYAAIAPQHDANGVVTETDPRDPAAVGERRVPRQPGDRDRLDAVRRLDTVVKSYARGAEDAGVRRRRPRLRRPRDRRGVQLRVRDPHARHAGQAARRRRRQDARAKTAPKADESDLPAGPTLHGKPGGAAGRRPT